MQCIVTVSINQLKYFKAEALWTVYWCYLQWHSWDSPT